MPIRIDANIYIYFKCNFNNSIYIHYHQVRNHHSVNASVSRDHYNIMQHRTNFAPLECFREIMICDSARRVKAAIVL